MGNSRIWTKKMDKTLKEMYLNSHIDELKKALNLTADQIYRRARTIGVLDKEHWTKEETDLIKFHYSELGCSVCSRLLGKNPRSVEYMAKKLHCTVSENAQVPELISMIVNDKEIHTHLYGQNSADCTIMHMMALWKHKYIDQTTYIVFKKRGFTIKTIFKNEV